MVKRLDVVPQRGVRRGVILPGPRGEEFGLQGAEEALHRGVVPAVAATTHAGADASAGEQLPIAAAGVLAAAVGVMEEAPGGAASHERHVQGGADERGGRGAAHRPPNHAPRGEVKNHGQITPARAGGTSGEVGRPDD